MAGCVVIFEFCDTLFPTSFFAARGYDALADAAELPIEVGWSMSALEGHVIALLERTLQHGEACVVTKGPFEDMRRAFERFAPRLWDFVLQSDVVLGGREGDELPLDAWLAGAFLLSALAVGPNAATEKLVVLSVGGGEPECAAARRLKAVHPKVAFKLVKLHEPATPEQLADLVVQLAAILPQTIAEYGDEEVVLRITEDS